MDRANRILSLCLPSIPQALVTLALFTATFALAVAVFRALG